MDTTSFLDIVDKDIDNSKPALPTNGDDIMSSIFDSIPSKNKKVDSSDIMDSIFDADEIKKNQKVKVLDQIENEEEKLNSLDQVNKVEQLNKEVEQVQKEEDKLNEIEQAEEDTLNQVDKASEILQQEDEKVEDLAQVKQEEEKDELNQIEQVDKASEIFDQEGEKDEIIIEEQELKVEANPLISQEISNNDNYNNSSSNDDSNIISGSGDALTIGDTANLQLPVANNDDNNNESVSPVENNIISSSISSSNISSSSNIDKNEIKFEKEESKIMINDSTETSTITANTNSASSDSNSNNNNNSPIHSMSVSSVYDDIKKSEVTVGTIEQEVFQKKVELISPLKLEFDKMFFSTIPLEKTPFEVLKMNAFTGALKYSPLRGIAWKIFLGGLDINKVNTWEKEYKNQRERYSKLREEHCFDPRTTNSVYDPLSQNDDSPWNKFFKNLDVQKIIKIDLERTHPDNEFFQNENIREIMSRILFIYSKTNGIISYRQGMHELLAPIIHLYHQEYTEYQKLDEGPKGLVDYIYNREYLEHDTFSTFESLMKFTSDWYAPAPPPSAAPAGSSSANPLASNNSQNIIGTSPSQSLHNSFNGDHSDLSNSQTKFNEVVQKCKYIHSVLLKQKDFELYQHLDSIDIEPQIYLLRWIRLLFGREFHFEDVLNIWDAIFAYGEDLVLIDYFCISMLTYIREQLLQSDSVYALKRIYKYPPVEDVYSLIKKALEIKDSNCSIAVMVKSASNPPNNSSNNNNSSNRNISLSNSSLNISSSFLDTSNNGNDSPSSFLPYSSQISSSSTTPVDNLSTKTTPSLNSTNSENKSINNPLNFSSSPSSSSSSLSTTATNATTTSSSSNNTSPKISHQNNNNNSNNNIFKTFNITKSSGSGFVKSNPKDLFGIKESDLNLFSSSSTSSSSSAPNSLNSSTNISIGQARSTFFSSSKHKSLQFTKSPLVITDTQKSKNSQTYLGNSLNDVIPSLEKVEKYINNNNNNSGGSSNEDHQNFLLAISKVKEIRDMLLSALPIPEDLVQDNSINNNNDNKKSTSIEDPLK